MKIKLPQVKILISSLLMFGLFGLCLIAFDGHSNLIINTPGWTSKDQHCFAFFLHILQHSISRNPLSASEHAPGHTSVSCLSHCSGLMVGCYPPSGPTRRSSPHLYTFHSSSFHSLSSGSLTHCCALSHLKVIFSTCCLLGDPNSSWPSYWKL